MVAKLTTTEYKTRLKEKFGNKLKVLQEYIDAITKIKHKCSKGHIFYAQPCKVVKGVYGCYECARLVVNKNNNTKKTTEQYREQVKIISSGKIKVLDEYINNRTKIRHQCDKEHIWETMPITVLAGKNCPLCNKITTLDFVKIMRKNRPNIIVLGEYVNAKTHIKLQCKINRKHIWSASPDSVINQNRGCPYCAGGIKHTQQIFEERLKSIHGDTVIPQEPYINSLTKIKCKCSKCNKMWWVTSQNLLNNSSGCPNCNKRNSKEGLEFIEFLEKTYNLEIQNLEKGGEKVLECDKHRYQADGFINEWGLVIEFFGDYWHGFFKKSAFEKRMYKRTITRFNDILKTGYPILFIWQHQYRQEVPPQLVIPKYNKTLVKWARKNEIPYCILDKIKDFDSLWNYLG